MIAKCGKHRVWHWAHWKSKDCDPWWEPETEWHRSWKNQFPVEWQEIGHTAQSGERHRADVKTRRDGLNPILGVERSRAGVSRAILHKIGLGRSRRQASPRPKEILCVALWSAACRVGTADVYDPPRRQRSVARLGKSRAPVYFDFGATEQGDSPLWRLYPLSGDVGLCVANCSSRVRQGSSRWSQPRRNVRSDLRTRPRDCLCPSNTGAAASGLFPIFDTKNATPLSASTSTSDIARRANVMTAAGSHRASVPVTHHRQRRRGGKCDDLCRMFIERRPSRHSITTTHHEAMRMVSRSCIIVASVSVIAVSCIVQRIAHRPFAHDAHR